MMGILVILIALGLLIYLAYRGVSLLILTPALATFAVVATMDGPVLASYTQIFMGATGNFITLYFPVFLLGAMTRAITPAMYRVSSEAPPSTVCSRNLSNCIWIAALRSR